MTVLKWKHLCVRLNISGHDFEVYGKLIYLQLWSTLTVMKV